MDDRPECKFSVNCYRRNPAHFIEFSHPLAEEIAGKINSGDIEHVISLNLSPAVLEQAQHVAELISNNELEIPQSDKKNVVKGMKRARAEVVLPNQDSTSKEIQLNDEIMELPSCSSSKKLKYEQVPLVKELGNVDAPTKQDMLHSNETDPDVILTPLVSVADKIESSSPFRFFLSSITAIEETKSQALSLNFADTLSPSLGILKESVQINFMVELGWLLAQYCYHRVQRKKLLIIYGVESEEMQGAHKLVPTIQTVRVKPKYPFGSHHTKMSLLAYEDGSLRMVVHTGNLIESDWENRTQGLWISPKCCPGLTNPGKDSTTGFKRDLLRYLNAYSLTSLQPWIEKIKNCDMDHINVCFIASIPGSFHKEESHMWGHGYLQRLLKEHAVEEKEEKEGVTVMQASSIGSLGPNPCSWFLDEIGKSMSVENKDALDVKVIYPCYKDVASSIDGLLGGGCLPYSTKGHHKQKWLTPFLHKWRSDGRLRTRAMPHIKSYCRFSSDFTRSSWFVLTSANLSKAAWGMRTKHQSIMIQSYEAGVLFLPKFINGGSTFRVGQELHLPYDTPLTEYEYEDEPWFIDHLR